MSDLSPETRAFIEVASRGDAPTADDRARVRHRLTLELGAVALTATGLTVAAQGTANAAGQGAMVSAGAGVVGGKTAAGISVIGKWLAAVSLVGAVSTGAIMASQSSPAKPLAKPVVAVSQPVKHESEPLALTQEPKPISAPAAVNSDQTVEAEPQAQTALVRPARRKERAVPDAAETVSAIAEETALLQNAQLALKAGNPQLALAHASEHARRFAQGALAVERNAVTMLARCAQGPLDTKELDAYLESAPESPLKARVKKACASRP